MTEQFQPTSTETNRSKARTSAAMLGLAISVGATSLLLPRQGDNVMAAEPPAAADQNPEATSQSHIIQPGETLAQIASDYSTSVDALLSLNGLQADDLLQVGQALQIPRKPGVKPDLDGLIAGQPSDDEAAFASKPTTAAKLNPKPTISLLDDKGGLNQGQAMGSAFGGAIPNAKALPTLPDTVQVTPEQKNSIPVIDASQGKDAADLETLAAPEVSEEQTLAIAAPVADRSVAAAKGEALAVIRDSSPVVAGDSDEALEVPLTLSQGSEGETLEDGSELAMLDTSAIASAKHYQVKAGDTLGQVAQRYGVSLQSLVQANDLDSPHMIRAGQLLVVPPVMGADLATYAISGAESVVASAESVSPAVGTVPVIPQPQATDVTASPSASLSPLPQDASSGQRTARNPYITGLQAEIRALQQKYEGRLSAVLSKGPAALESSRQAAAAPRARVGTPGVAAALIEERDLAPALSESESLGALPPLHAPSDAEVAVAEPQQLALASPRLNDRNPTVQSLLGQTVSPSLPPLASADAYLPDNMTFDGYIWPTKGVFTSGYGWRWGRMHKGIDIAAPIGTPIVAAADGVVTFSGWNSGGYGNLVDIRHEDGSLTRYAHNSRNLVKRGQKVRQGQLIAEMGSTGRSTGPHLHFEIRKPGQGAINPKALLPKGGLRAAR